MKKILNSVFVQVLVFAVFLTASVGAQAAAYPEPIPIGTGDLPDVLDAVVSADKLLDHALQQVENDGRGDASLYSVGFVNVPGQMTYIEVPANGRDQKLIRAEMAATKFKFALIDPEKDQVNVCSRIWNANNEILFEGCQSFKLERRDGNWVVPDANSVNTMYLRYEVPLDLPVRVFQAQVLVRGNGREYGDQWLNLNLNQFGKPLFPKDLAGAANEVLKISYEGPGGKYSEKVFSIKTGKSISPTNVVLQEKVGIDDFVSFDDDGLAIGEPLFVFVKVLKYRTFSPLVRITIKVKRVVQVFAVAVEEDGETIAEVAQSFDLGEVD